MDGLMLDTESINRAAWQQAARDLGYEVSDALYMTFVGRRTADCEQDLITRFGAEFPMEDFRPRWRECRRVAIARTGIPIKPGLLDLLRFADDRGVPIAVATSSGGRTAEATLGAAGLLDRFRVIVTGDQVVAGKPAPDIYLEAARRLGVHPARCVALEDSDAGVLSAHAAGMRALHIPDLKAPSDAATAVAFRVLRSLHEAQALLETVMSAASAVPTP
jgi:HAD superfamily hydrolase (TIGR01509 family)